MIYVKQLLERITLSSVVKRARLLEMFSLSFSPVGRRILLCLLPVVVSAVSVRSEVVLLSEPDAPEQADVFYIDDRTNSGLVIGDREGIVVRIDKDPVASITVGDLFNQERQEGRIRKFFLMFQLPEIANRKLTRAELSLYLGFRSSDKTGIEVPPLHLYHAKHWPDEAWQKDPDFRGLTTSAFSDKELFGEKVVIAEKAPNGPVIVDITKIVQENYKRGKQPVVVFRIEIADGTRLDITDDISHTYNFWGPGQAVEKSPGRAPALNLTFE
jgi:hypothetical protein